MPNVINEPKPPSLATSTHGDPSFDATALSTNTSGEDPQRGCAGVHQRDATRDAARRAHPG